MPSSGTSPASTRRCSDVLGLDLPVEDWAKEEGIADEEMRERIERRADEHMAAQGRANGAPRSCAMSRRRSCCRRSTISGASTCHARAPAPGDRPARLRPARSAQRIQGGGLQPVRGHDASACARRSPRQLMRVEIVQQPPPEEPSKLPYMEAHKIDPTTGEDEMALPRWRRHAVRRNGNGRAQPSAIRTIRELGQGRPQRGLPVRLGQEIQALPRQVRLERRRYPDIKNAGFARRFLLQRRRPAHRVHGASGGLAIVFADDTGRGSPTPFAAGRSGSLACRIRGGLAARATPPRRPRYFRPTGSGATCWPSPGPSRPWPAGRRSKRRCAQTLARTQPTNFHIPPKRTPPRRVSRAGSDCHRGDLRVRDRVRPC